jgi:thiol:disulfide interchange protein DsbD
VRRKLALLSVGVVLLATSGLAQETVFSATARWQVGPPLAGETAVTVVTVTVKPTWHVNSNAPLDEFLIPTAVTLELPTGWAADKPVFPPHRSVKLAFSEEPVSVFEGSFDVTVAIHAAAGTNMPAELKGVVEAQACNDKVCLAPAEVAFVLPLAGALGPAENFEPIAVGANNGKTSPTPAPPTDGTLASTFAQGGLLFKLLLVFLAGLALNLTPCVYPLIPITIGFFVSQRGTSKARTWSLGVIYVLGMSVTYSALGVAAALSGKLFGAALQSPWIVGAVVIVLLALASSMFGLWELRVPSWVTGLSGGRGGLGGALVMGLMVGLVAAPCIGPFVLGLLTYVGQQQDVTLGFLLFFVLSMGLGLPYLLLAVFTGALERMPNSGAWMLGVRQLFGVLLVALAGYFAKPLLPSPSGDWLFAGLLIIGGLYLLLIARPGHEQPWIDRAMRAAAAAVLVAGVLLAPRHENTTNGVTWQSYDEAAVEAALAAGGPVLLDFYADWCLPCKELDKETFSDATVAARLAGFARFKVDLTKSTPATEALRAHFGVAGVPTIAFFSGGKEVVAVRLTGFEPPKQFLERLGRISENQ